MVSPCAMDVLSAVGVRLSAKADTQRLIINMMANIKEITFSYTLLINPKSF